MAPLVAQVAVLVSAGNDSSLAAPVTARIAIPTGGGVPDPLG
jgi:hypothetical protein